MLMPHSSSLRTVSLPLPPAAPATGFVPGTRIGTAEGWLPVEHLMPGDRVALAGGGFARLAGVSRVRALGVELVVLPAEAAEGLRARLALPVAHPVLAGDWRARVLFGAEAVLARAGHLAERVGARLERRAVQPLIRLAFARPCVIRAEGLAVGCGTAPAPAAALLH